MADGLSIRWIEAVVTCELLRHCCCPIRPICQGPWHDHDRLGSANQRAGQFTNHQALGLWGSFFVFRIVDRQHIARILDQSMLKPSSGADERPALCTRELDGLQGALHTFVRTGWRTPQGVKALQRGLAVGMVQ